MILAQKYNVRIRPPSVALASTIQVPEALTLPFQRKLHVRQHTLGGVCEPGRDRILRWFYAPGRKNTSHSEAVRGADTTAAAAARLVWNSPRPRSWTLFAGGSQLVLKYFPPGHALAAFAKSRPAVVVSLDPRASTGHGAVYRTTLKKHLRRYLFEAICKVQGITRETAEWSDVRSFEPMSDDENLAFLLEDHRDPELVRAEKELLQESLGVSNERESFLVKRDRNFIHDIDGLYYFCERNSSTKKYVSKKDARRIAYAAVQTSIADFGYVSAEIKAEFLKNSDELKKKMSKAVQLAHYRTSRTHWQWVVAFNERYSAAIPQLRSETRLLDDEQQYYHILDTIEKDTVIYKNTYEKLRDLATDEEDAEASDKTRYFPPDPADAPAELLQYFETADLKERTKKRSLRI